MIRAVETDRRDRKGTGLMKTLRTVMLGIVLSIFSIGGLAASDLTGQTAPDFVLKSSTGENLRLSE